VAAACLVWLRRILPDANFTGAELHELHELHYPGPKGAFEQFFV
jgi:hypothetical protein